MYENVLTLLEKKGLGIILFIKLVNFFYSSIPNHSLNLQFLMVLMQITT